MEDVFNTYDEGITSKQRPVVGRIRIAQPSMNSGNIPIESSNLACSLTSFSVKLYLHHKSYLLLTKVWPLNSANLSFLGSPFIAMPRPKSFSSKNIARQNCELLRIDDLPTNNFSGIPDANPHVKIPQFGLFKARHNFVERR